jgi:hypothetical protein
MGLSAAQLTSLALMVIGGSQLVLLQRRWRTVAA